MKLSPFGGFEDWSKKVRSALVWLGRPDPCETMEVIRMFDPKTNNLVEIMEQWEKHFGKKPMKIGEVIAHAEDVARNVWEEKDGIKQLKYKGDTELRDALAAVCECGLSAKAVSQWLGKQNGNWIGGRCFIVQTHAGSKISKRFVLVEAGDEHPGEEGF